MTNVFSKDDKKLDLPNNINLCNNNQRLDLNG